MRSLPFNWSLKTRSLLCEYPDRGLRTGSQSGFALRMTKRDCHSERSEESDSGAMIAVPALWASIWESRSFASLRMTDKKCHSKSRAGFALTRSVPFDWLRAGPSSRMTDKKIVTREGTEKN